MNPLKLTNYLLDRLGDVHATGQTLVELNSLYQALLELREAMVDGGGIIEAEFEVIH